MGLRILVVCDADDLKGFGHLSRCIYILEELLALLETPIHVYFDGSYSEKAKGTVNNRLPKGSYEWKSKDVRYFDVGLIDTMFDVYDMDFYPNDRLREISKRCNQVLLIASSRTIPDQLPENFSVIGHMLDESSNRRPHVFSGLKYAPVTKEVTQYFPEGVLCRKEIKQIFIGIGSWKDSRSLYMILDAIAEEEFRGRVQVLLSLSHQQCCEDLRSKYCSLLNIDFLQNIPTVYPYLSESDLVFCSYGNLMFEAMALGRVCAVIGLKNFQSEYSSLLAEKEVIHFIASTTNLKIESIRETFKLLDYNKRNDLSKKSANSIDGLGIHRLAVKASELANLKMNSI